MTAEVTTHMGMAMAGQFLTNVLKPVAAWAVERVRSSFDRGVNAPTSNQQPEAVADPNLLPHRVTEIKEEKKEVKIDVVEVLQRSLGESETARRAEAAKNLAAFNKLQEKLDEQVLEIDQAEREKSNAERSAALAKSQRQCACRVATVASILLIGAGAAASTFFAMRN